MLQKIWAILQKNLHISEEKIFSKNLSSNDLAEKFCPFFTNTRWFGCPDLNKPFLCQAPEEIIDQYKINKHQSQFVKNLWRKKKNEKSKVDYLFMSQSYHKKIFTRSSYLKKVPAEYSELIKFGKVGNFRSSRYPLFRLSYPKYTKY